jgi:peptidyl-prolyl cis-trans isomerase SurA
MSLSAQRGELRVLLSELVLPATPDNLELAEMIAADSTPEEFEDAARLYSLAPTRAAGGRLDWTPVAGLPPMIRPVVEALQPGQVSAPIPLENAVLLLLLRGADRSLNLPPSAIRVEYARAVLPAGRAAEDLGRLRARVDACPVFMGVLGDLPETATGIETATLATLPTGVGARIARMDEGEIDAETRPDGSVDVLMLCSRTPGTADEAPDRNLARERLIDQRLTQLSAGLLAELRAAAVIERR